MPLSNYKMDKENDDKIERYYDYEGGALGNISEYDGKISDWSEEVEDHIASWE